MITKKEENGYLVNLAQNREDLELIKRLMTESVGLDTETTGLDFDDDCIVGVCLAFGAPLQGYYLPIRHNYGNNLPVEDVIEILRDIIDNRTSVLFNRNFDFSMIEKEGVRIPFSVKSHDVQVMCWEATNEEYPALKDFSRRFLRLKMTDYTDNFSESDSKKDKKDKSFANTDPEFSFVYAAMDAVATVLLGRKIWSEYPYIRKIYPIDNKVTEAVRLMGQAQIAINFDKVKEHQQRAEAKLREIRTRAHIRAGYQFNLGSNKEKGEALSRFVTLTVKTKSGKFFKVNEEILEEIDHPLAKDILEYSLTIKFISSYINPLLAMEGKPIRFNYKMTDAPTGRSACGQSKGNKYYAKMNVQAIVKEEKMKYLHKGGELGYYLDDVKEGSIGEQKVKAGLREAFCAPEGYWFMSLDYISEEMCIVANLSKERTFLDAIIEGKDLHTNTAEVVFKIVDKAARSKVKILNFASLYGASPFSLSKKMAVTVDEAADMLKLYYKRLPNLSRWKDDVIAEARRKGIIFTYYGRPRLLYKYYSSSDYKIKAFADRSAVNSTVQGCLPANVLMEIKDGVILPLNHFGKKLIVEHPQGVTEAVVTGRGENFLLYLKATGGNFIICDANHKLVAGTKEKMNTWNMESVVGRRVNLSPLQKKRMINKSVWQWMRYPVRTKVFLKSKTLQAQIGIDRTISSAIWAAFFMRMKFELTKYQAASMRSIGSVYGFNLVEVSDRNYMFKWSRGRRAKIKTVIPIEMKGTCSMTVMKGAPVYYSQGFVNKNTGADILRITLIKIYDRIFKDPEFAANVIPAIQVHDEVNFYVKKPYLKKAADIVKPIMTIKNSNWEATLNSQLAVGPDWGSCVDCEGIDENNKLIVKL